MISLNLGVFIFEIEEILLHSLQGYHEGRNEVVCVKVICE